MGTISFILHEPSRDESMPDRIRSERGVDVGEWVWVLYQTTMQRHRKEKTTKTAPSRVVRSKGKTANSANASGEEQKR